MNFRKNRQPIAHPKIITMKLPGVAFLAIGPRFRSNAPPASVPAVVSTPLLEHVINLDSVVGTRHTSRLKPLLNRADDGDFQRGKVKGLELYYKIQEMPYACYNHLLNYLKEDFEHMKMYMADYMKLLKAVHATIYLKRKNEFIGLPLHGDAPDVLILLGIANEEQLSEAQKYDEALKADFRDDEQLFKRYAALLTYFNEEERLERLEKMQSIEVEEITIAQAGATRGYNYGPLLDEHIRKLSPTELEQLLKCVILELDFDTEKGEYE